MLRKSVWAGALLSLLLPVVAFAQVNAVVSGSVSDASGALIPGSEVVATNVNTGIATTQLTNETGGYNFASLQPGTYRVSASLSGFQTQTYQNVLLSQGQQIRLNFTLEVAAVGDTVEVTIDADATLATTSASVGDVLPVQEVASLPLPVRDVLALIESTAGASGRNFGGQGQRSLNMTRDGLIVNDTRYGTGAQVGTFVSSDLVEEVQVVVGNVDAEAGRGSGQVSLQTRSGTNEFHGALFYFNANSALSANTFLQNFTGQQKTYENRNQFGGRLGGPIVRNKAFFFVLIDEQRFLRKENYVATVLTPQARQGIFRYIAGRQNGNALSATRSVDLNGNILDPANLRSFNLFSDVQDPLRTGISNNAYFQWVLANMPLPNDYTVGDGLNTAGHRWLRPIDGLGGGNTVGNENNRDQLNIRLDYQVNDRNKITFTTSREEDWGVTTNLISDWPNFGYNGTNNYFPHLYTLGWTSTLSPRVLNEFRFGYKETSYHRRAPFQVGCCFDSAAESWNDRDPEAEKAFALLTKSNGYPIFPIFATPSLSIPMKHGFDTTRGQKSPTRQFSDTLSWTQGSHSFKAGWETVRIWSDGWNTTSEQIPTAVFGNGNFAVSNITTTRFPGLNSNDITTATAILNDLANSVQGLTFGRVINSATQTTWQDFLSDPRRFRHLTQSDWALFFKDSWNVTQNLTLNLGVRYDKYGVLYDQKGMLARAKGGENALLNFRRDGTLTESQLVGKGSTSPDELFWPNDWNNIGPSIGFSYRIPWIQRTTTLRGGYGINYAGNPVILDYENDFGNSPGSVDVYGNNATSGTPFVPNTYTTLSTAVMPLPAKTQPGIIRIPLTDKTQAMNTPTDNRATPYIQSFNLSVQHDLSRGLTLEVSYIGNKGTKLFDKYNINEPEIFANGMLEAFNITRAGGTAPLFDRLLMNRVVPGVGTVNGTTLTGSEAFRRWASTRTFLALGSVAQFADFVSTTNALTGTAGGLLTNAGLRQDFITASPQFLTAQIWGTARNSSYHSMQTQLRKLFSNGFSGQLTYTWSKALGDTVGGETGSAVLDPRNRSLNKGRLNFDHTHVINAHNTWELPIGTGRFLLGGASGWLNHVVSGWQISTITSYSSGDPLTLTSPVRSIVNINNGNVPNIVGAFPKSTGEVVVQDGFIEYFTGYRSVQAPTAGLYGSDPNNLAQFSTNRNIVDASGNVILTNPQPGQVGTLGTRWVDGPGQFGLDLSLAKKIRVREGVEMTFRADAIDALNTPQWGNPNVNINSADFGRITTSTGNRKITLSARIDF